MQVLPRRLFAIIKEAAQTQSALALTDHAVTANEGAVQGKMGAHTTSALSLRVAAGAVAMGKLTATVTRFSG